MEWTLETITVRWRACFINDAQLQRMKNLNVITQEQFDQLWQDKYGPPVIDIPVEPPVEPEPPVEEPPAEGEA